MGIEEKIKDIEEEIQKHLTIRQLPTILEN